MFKNMYKSFPMSISGKLDSIKNTYGYTIGQYIDLLAGITGRSTRTARRWLSGESRPKDVDLEKICEHFALSKYHFLADDSAIELTDRLLGSSIYGAALVKNKEVIDVNHVFKRLFNVEKLEGVCNHIIGKQHHMDFAEFCEGSDEFAKKFGFYHTVIPLYVYSDLLRDVNINTIYLGDETFIRLFS